MKQSSALKVRRLPNCFTKLSDVTSDRKVKVPLSNKTVYRRGRWTGKPNHKGDNPTEILWWLSVNSSDNCSSGNCSTHT